LLSVAFLSSSVFFVIVVSLSLRPYGLFGEATFFALFSLGILALGFSAVKLGYRVSGLAALLVSLFFALTVATQYFPSAVLSLFMLSFPFAWLRFAEGKGLSGALEALGVRRERLLLNAGVGLGSLFLIYPVIIIETLVLVYVFGIRDIGNVSGIITSAPLWVSVFAVVFAPFAEEIFFRGFLIDKVGELVLFIAPALRSGVSRSILAPLAGVAVSSLIFSLAHYTYGSVAEFAGAFTVGVAFALLYLRTRNVASVIAAHAVFNLFSIVAIYFGNGGVPG
jgi:hypothetical protein